jgi:Caspase domain
MLARSQSGRLAFAVFAALFLGWTALAHGQAAREEARIALVIGNATYRESPLRNPVNDARAMAKTLRELGFTVLAHENATKRTMETAVIEFGRKLAEGGVGFFYYAGHGLQVRGRNYLVPIDAEIDSEAATRIAAVDVDLLLEQMAEAKNRVNVVILDACRNNPFERRLRGASRGLAAVDAARGTLVAYATAPGSVAADGEGANGLYTEELLQALRVPGLKVEEVFKRVRIGVTERSKGAQTPWESSSLTGDLVVNVTVNVTTAALPAPPSTADREALFWMSIKDGTDRAAFEAYLKQYPDGTFAPLARQRLAGLAARPPALNPARFDGTWNVTVQCPPHKDGAGYSMRFLVQIKDGVLAGQHGVAGQPGSLALSGKIEPDGNAHINARGVTADPKFTLNRLSPGSAYSYRVVDARFETSRGSGKRVEPRPCNLTFEK